MVLAVLRRPWGKAGELRVELHTDWPQQRFAAGTRLELRRRDGRIVHHLVERLRSTSTGPLLRLAGIDSITAAQPLAGAEVVGRMDQLERPNDVELLHADLIGRQLQDPSGSPLGRIVAVDEAPGGPLLVIETTAGSEVLVPFVPEFFPHVDRTAERLTAVLPIGLIHPEDAEIARGPEGRR